MMTAAIMMRTANILRNGLLEKLRDVRVKSMLRPPKEVPPTTAKGGATLQPTIDLLL
jgi:hypothetical protein